MSDRDWERLQRQLSYGERAGHAFGAVVADMDAELRVWIDRMPVDDLYALHVHALRLASVARDEWLNQTRRPRNVTESGQPPGG